MHGFDGRIGGDRGTAPNSALEKAQVILPRIERGEIGDERAAVIELAADLPVLCRARHHLELVAEVLPPRRELARELVILPSRVGGNVAAADLEGAIDRLRADGIANRIIGGPQLAIDCYGRFHAAALDEREQAPLKRAADVARVSRRGAVAGDLGLEHEHAAPGGREHARRIEAGDAGADDGDIHAPRKCRIGECRPGCRLPPVRCGGEAAL